MKHPFARTEELEAELDALQPIAPENEQRLWQKLRLEWNYHSNHIEGNTLTYGETELLLLHDQTHGNHTLREFLEMKAHDVGIVFLQKLAADVDRIISPADVRDLNGIILKEPFWKPTRTLNGQPTRSQVIPGEYKTLPNSVITATGEIFEYASPVEVPARMQALMDWLADALSQKSGHIVSIAARLHHDFVLIHPFDDGNGRVARMLVNYLFLREGFPPIIVPTEQKAAYLASLRLADAGEIGELEKFFATQLENSLALAIRAGKGESINEPSDAEKRVAIFIREQKAKTASDEPTDDLLAQFAVDSLNPLLRELRRKIETLSPLFHRIDYLVVDGNDDFVENPFSNHVSKSLLSAIRSRKMFINFTLNKFNGVSSVQFDLQTVVKFEFMPDRYLLNLDGTSNFERKYKETLLRTETDRITADFLESTLESIQKQSTR